MTARYFGIDRGTGSAFGVVTTGTSTTSKSVELTTQDAAGLTRADLQALAERLIRYACYEDTASTLAS